MTLIQSGCTSGSGGTREERVGWSPTRMAVRQGAQLVSIPFLAGCVDVMSHDPQMAAMGAEKFARAALLRQEPGKAYSPFTEEGKKDVSLDKLADAIKQLHRTGYPSRVSAVEFEPIPRQRAMNVFLTGEGEKEAFYYRLVMQGTADTGYVAAWFFRGSGPPPASSLRKRLPANPSESAPR